MKLKKLIRNILINHRHLVWMTFFSGSLLLAACGTKNWTGATLLLAPAVALGEVAIGFFAAVVVMAKIKEGDPESYWKRFLTFEKLLLGFSLLIFGWGIRDKRKQEEKSAALRYCRVTLIWRCLPRVEIVAGG